MKKQFIIGTSLVVSFVLGMTAGNYALSDQPMNVKIGLVDVTKLVDSSSEIKALKNSHNKKAEELKAWIEVAKTDVEKQKTKEGQQKLAQKYENDLIKKQEYLSKTFQKELADIDKNIGNVVKERSKAMGYDIVFNKSAVLYGGEDITSSIQKYIK
ncbi:OmpH family outer membrane protein [bacterium]|nr:OmpH family outer membrane protein [bacterium]